MNAVKTILRLIARFPPIKKFRLARYRRQFFAPGTTWPRFFGLFETRAEAESAALSGNEMVGYDHAEVVQVSLEIMATIWTSDYPIIFWLSRVLGDHNRLFDLGGHIGTKFRAWRKYLDLPDHFTWTVCDLPSIVEAGRKMSTDFPQMQFTTNPQDADGQPILIASGMLQYADFEIGDILEKLSVKPKHLLINRVPTHNLADVYTLENLHYSIVPYRIFNEEKLLNRFVEIGYTLIDRWEIPEISVHIPFTSFEKSVHCGYYLRLAETGRAQ